jgi:hypothetical protein
VREVHRAMLGLSVYARFLEGRLGGDRSRDGVGLRGGLLGARMGWGGLVGRVEGSGGGCVEGRTD